MVEALERRRRAVAAMRRYLLASMIMTLVLIGYVLWQSYAGRVRSWESNFASCQRGLLERVDNIEEDQDQAAFLHSSASFRADVRQPGAARRSQDLAERADARVRRRMGRLLGARWVVLSEQTAAGDPTGAARLEAARACRGANPYPSLKPW